MQALPPPCGGPSWPAARRRAVPYTRLLLIALLGLVVGTAGCTGSADAAAEVVEDAATCDGATACAPDAVPPDQRSGDAAPPADTRDARDSARHPDGASPAETFDGCCARPDTPQGDTEVHDLTADAPAGDAAPSGPCRSDADCLGRVAPLGACGYAACDRPSGRCVERPLPDGSPCDDADRCTHADVCRAGRCGGRPLPCDDGNPCTTSLCSPAGGCTHAPNDATCDDGNACTSADRCHAGGCHGTPGPDCACADDADCAPFDDGSLCTGLVRCIGGTCTIEDGAAVRCDPLAAGPCETARCDPGTGTCAMVRAVDGTPCDDGDACTQADFCQAGACVGSAPRDCAELAVSACEEARCLPAVGCVVTSRVGRCADGDNCTAGDQCQDGRCGPGSTNRCNETACLPARTLTCNRQETWSFADAGEAATQLVEQYACRPDLSLPGAEVAYSFVAPYDGDADVTLSEAPPGTRLFVLAATGGGCDPRACRAFADPTAGFTLTAGQTHYVVVDGPPADAGAAAFSLDLRCRPAREHDCGDARDDDANGLTDCADPACACPPVRCRPSVSMGCGAAVWGATWTLGATHDIAEYGPACAGAPLPGGEFAARFTAPVAGRYEARVHDATAAVELLAVPLADDACVPTACFARGLGRVAFDAAAGADYALVVERADGGDAQFALTVACPAGVEAPCNDARDNDGDGASDCADADCGTDPACPAAGCRPVAVLGCGDVFAADTAGPLGQSTLAAYACSFFAYAGPEVSVDLQVPDGAALHAALTAAPPDVDLFLLASADESCLAEQCVAQGDTTLDTRVVAGYRYRLVVDGYAGAAGPFVLRVDCMFENEVQCVDGRDDDDDGLTDCRDPDCAGLPPCPRCPTEVAPLQCGDEVAGSTEGSVAGLTDRYGCSAHDYPGPERRYRFVPPHGVDAEIELLALSGAPDVLVTEGTATSCNPAACIAHGPGYVRFDAESGVAYDLFVDGYDGGPTAYVLRLNCTY